MLRNLMVGITVTVALTMPAAAQKRVTVEQVLTQLHGLCEGEYTPRVSG
jgi:hypothetical protein